MFLVVFVPLNVIWLTCVVTFGLLHRAWLGRLEKRVPAGNANTLRVRSVLIGLALGLALAAIACLVFVHLHTPGPYEDMDDDAAPPAYAATVTLLMYGVSSWLASVAAGWALGWLWMRRAVAQRL